MGKFQDKVCLSVCWGVLFSFYAPHSKALMVIYNTAERQYATLDRKLTWNEARNHCQVCFKELVTLTHDNIENIVKGLSSEHWIGLRKSLNSTSDSNMSWSRWSNGDPLTFQNWQPGWPVFPSSVPVGDCCSCSCTCPAATAPTMSSFTNSPATSSDDMNITGPEATCTWSPMPAPTVFETEETYIEDSCVAMLSFGPWVEKNCSELLPFICYEDHFPGNVSLASVTSERATLTWPRVPGSISHYEVVANGDSIVNVTDLTYDLVNLTAGSRYEVDVLPVKCGRNLDPLNVTFYTTPNKVKKLTVTRETETSIQLNWTQPDGNLDFYLLQVDSQPFRPPLTTEGEEVDGLTPGSFYTFTVLSGVKDDSTTSEKSVIPAYTRPGKVSNLVAGNNTNSSLSLCWEPPEGGYSGFRVKAMDSSDHTWFDKKWNQHPCDVPVTDLPMGTKITLYVYALANDSLNGDNTTTFSYTEPGPISDLTVITGHSSLNATWAFPEGSDSSFTAKLLLDGTTVNTKINLTERRTTFSDLKTATKYTVVVYAVSGHLNGPPVEHSNFTLPSPPTNAIATSVDKNTITFEWSAPDNITKAMYVVKINSSFWGQNRMDTVYDKTSYTFSNLTSGTRYCFEVYIEAGGVNSTPEVNCAVRTATEERQISLSMLCSSAVPLHCDQASTRTSVLKQLRDHFNELLKDYIDWSLEQQQLKHNT